MRAVDGVSRTGAEARTFGCQDIATAAGAAAIDVEARSKVARERFAVRRGN